MVATQSALPKERGRLDKRKETRGSGQSREKDGELKLEIPAALLKKKRKRSSKETNPYRGMGAGHEQRLTPMLGMLQPTGTKVEERQKKSNRLSEIRRPIAGKGVALVWLLGRRGGNLESAELDHTVGRLFGQACGMSRSFIFLKEKKK